VGLNVAAITSPTTEKVRIVVAEMTDISIEVAIAVIETNIRKILFISRFGTYQ
jgi:hypothetical protein